MTMRVIQNLKRAGRSYDVFKLLVLGTANAVLLLALVTRGRDQLSRSYGNDAVVTAAHYCLTYWFAHWQLALLLVFLLLAVFGFDVLRQPFHALFRAPLLPTVERPHYQRHVRRLNTALKLTFCLALLVHVPLIHLRVGTWAPIWLYVFIPAPVVAVYIWIYGGELQLRRPAPALARHTYPSSAFNVAGVAYISEEARAELDFYEQVDDRLGYLIRGDARRESLWRGHGEFLRTIGMFLGADHMALRLFTNTTRALDHAVQECCQDLAARGQKPRLVTSDAEYGSVYKMLTTWADHYQVPLQVARIRERIYRGASSQEVLAELLRVLQPGADVVCLSYVCHETGFVMPLRELIHEVRSGAGTAGPRFIVDAAQAAGHIELDAEIVNGAHYFATSGHKWLLGQETLGILFANNAPGLAPPLPPPIKSDESLSVWAPEDELQKENLATIAPAPRLTLNAALADITQARMSAIARHNAGLARRFKELIGAHPGFRVVPIRAACGIVVVETRNPRRIERYLRREGFIVGTNNLSGLRPALRICFHYYHSEADVDGLAHAMFTAVT